MQSFNDPRNFWRQRCRWGVLDASWLVIQVAAWVIETKFGYFPWKIKQFLLLEYNNLFVAGCVFNRIFVSGFNASRIALLAFALLAQFLVHGLESVLVVAGFFAMFSLFCLNKLGFICVRPLMYLGSISYSLYLTHQNISYTLFRELYGFGVPQFGVFAIAIVTVILLAHLLTFYVERPAMQLVRRMYRARKQSNGLA